MVRIPARHTSYIVEPTSRDVTSLPFRAFPSPAASDHEDIDENTDEDIDVDYVEDDEDDDDDDDDDDIDLLNIDSSAETYVPPDERVLSVNCDNSLSEVYKIQVILRQTFKHEQAALKVVQDFNARQQLLLDLLAARDYGTMLDEIWALEIKAGLTDEELYTLKTSALLILLATDVPMLEGIIKNDLDIPDLPQSEIGNDAEPLRPPIIYRLSLVDSEGQRPSPEVLRVAREIVEKYARGELSQREHLMIDNYRPPSSLSEATYKYVSRVENKAWVRKKSRVDALNTFLEATRTSFRLSCIGFTASPEKRQDQHEKHTGSNFILNLVEAILNTDRRVKRKYVQLFQPIFQVFEPSHGIAEVVFTRLAGCAVNHGGCTHHPAGRSVSKLAEYSGNAWREFEDIALQTTSLRVNWAACKDKLENVDAANMQWE